MIIGIRQPIVGDGLTEETWWRGKYLGLGDYEELFCEKHCGMKVCEIEADNELLAILLADIEVTNIIEVRA